MTEEQKNKRDWLNRALEAEKKLIALFNTRINNKERAEHITRIFVEGNPLCHKNRFHNNTIENDLIRFLESDEKYDEYFQEYMNIKQEIETAISTIHNPMIEAIFIQRHLNFMSIEQIAETLNYSDRSIKRKYLEGLDKIDIHFG